MAAATEQVRIIIQRNRAARADANVTKALRGTKWKRGWFLVAHDDRLMPYPASGFNNAKASAMRTCLISLSPKSKAPLALRWPTGM